MPHPTLLQCFHWYTPEGGTLWPEIEERAQWLGEIGITLAWLPPATKGSTGGYSVGYDIYDLFDLGEFDQKGSIATKYGDKAALLAAINALRNSGIGTLMDTVFNHKMGADEKEAVKVNRVNPENREEIDDEVIEAEAWTRFTFPGRNKHYSAFIWDYHCFSGVDHIENPDENTLFKIVNDYTEEGWSDQVDDELGNFDYLMGANIDFRNNAVREELKFWARWIIEQTQCAGFRLDAVKHIPAWFYKEWLAHLQEHHHTSLFVVGEYWGFECDKLQTWIAQTEGRSMLFDAPLQNNFHHASRQGAEFDLRQIFSGTLVEADAFHAVTLVANHDTQPLQALEAPVEPWFKPLAYALILLREQGVPCVFYPDLFGANYRDKGDDGKEYDIKMPVINELEALIRARQQYAHGVQTDYFDEANCIAFSRSGTAEHPGCVVILSNGDEGEKQIALGEDRANSQWKDLLGHREETIICDPQGNGVFRCNAGSVSVWVKNV